MSKPRELQDAYFRRAKAEGYLARSAYKLLEIHDRKDILRKNDRILDVGCAPGSWLQVASRKSGPGAVIVGIDLKPCTHRFDPNVTTHVMDVRDAEAENLTPDGKPFDVLLSDMAPNTSGQGDDLVSAQLCRRVLELAPRVLRPGGRLVMKILEGAETQAVLRETRRIFVQAHLFKPKACRDRSRETYIIALGRIELPHERERGTPA